MRNMADQFDQIIAKKLFDLKEISRNPAYTSSVPNNRPLDFLTQNLIAHLIQKIMQTWSNLSHDFLMIFY
jgi:hypothetical protein